MAQIIDRQMIDNLSAHFQRRYEPNFAWANVAALMQQFPGLRGLWSMASVDGNGNALDISGRGLTLAYTGNPKYSFAGLAPYIDLDGAGDYLARADEAALDITGTEAFMAHPGLTIGGWFWLDAYGAQRRPLMSKWKFTASNNRAYQLFYTNASTAFQFKISTDGTAVVSITSSVTPPATGRWYWIVGRFTPSTELSIFVNKTKDTVLAAIPASIFNSNADLHIGTDDNITVFTDGRASNCFMVAAALSDTIINAAYEQTRALYGVKS